MPNSKSMPRAMRWAIVLGAGAILYFTPFAGLAPAQRHLLAIFAGTIVALVLQPAPMGASVLIATTLLQLTGTLPPAKILSGFANVTVWLIFTAFLFARAITSTGFGMRVGYLFVEWFARTPLTLGYSIAAVGVALAPFVPSDTGRGGGIMYPVTQSIADAFDSKPGPTARRIGSYLMLTGFHTNYPASALFLTSMASNPVMAEFAARIAHVNLSWVNWLRGSILPAILTFTLVPWLLMRLSPPEVRDTAPARDLARRELARMGKPKRQEKLLMAIMLGVMIGWITSPWHSVPNTFVALAGVCAILVFHVMEWDELLGERKAWDALIWFAPLVMMSDSLNETGVIKTLSSAFFSRLHGVPWPLALAVLVIGYLYIHYVFASMTAHALALYPAFLAAALACGCPPMLAALSFAYFSNLDAGITHYGTGSAPLFYGAGYVAQGDWWRIGFILSVANLAIWLGIGPWWQRLVGLW
ncbi:MAG: DASS family sodium-coupled anion symporter [Acidobacteria bacterium]|nr:DASS family sodium-coupled anion symporter [Acidobacteriota bacterium]